MGARASRPHPFVLSQIRCGGSLSKGSCPLSRLPIWDTIPPTNISPNLPQSKNHSSDNPLRALKITVQTIPLRPLVSFVDNRPPVIPTAHPSFRRRPESRGAGTWGIPLITKITRITVQTTPFAPLSVLRGQSPSFQPPTRHSGGGRNPEGRGRGESHQSQKSHESQFRQPPSRPLVSFVDNPRHSNRPPVIPAAAGIQRGGDVGNPTNHKNHTNHSSDNPFAPLSVLRGQSPSFQPPTRHSGGGRNPEGRGRGESH